MSEKLDTLDYKILSELDRNARRTTSQIARFVKQGRDRVEYRINRLEQLGIISQYTTVINPHRFGGSIYKIYLKAFAEEQVKKEFLLKLKKHPRVFWIAESDGTWNVMFSIVAKDPIEFSQFQNELLNPYGTLIHAHEVYPLIKASFFSRGYLNSKNRVQWDIGGNIVRSALDDVDISLIAVLNENARLSVVELAQRLNLTIDIIHYRMKKLELQKVILGYRAELNLPRIGTTLFKAQIYFDGFNPKLEKDFYSYCEKDPNIVYIVQQIGKCQYEIEIEAPDYYQYFSITDEIQRVFAGNIRTIDTSLVRSERLKWIKSVDEN